MQKKNHSNINPQRHLNRSNLQFNSYGRSIFVKNIRDFMTNLSVLNWLRKRDNLSSITSSPFLNDTSCLGFSNLFKQLAHDLANSKNERLSDPSPVIIGHLNITSFRNKYEMFAEFIKNFNIFLTSESKLDDSFPNKQFHINGFKIFRCDCNRYGSGLVLYIHEGIPCKPLKTYKPPVVNDLKFTNELIKILNYFSSKYENLIIIGDLNMSIGNVHLNTLLQLFNLNALMNSPTCYQSHIPTCIGHTLTAIICGSFKGLPKKKRFTDVIKTLILQILATL